MRVDGRAGENATGGIGHRIDGEDIAVGRKDKTTGAAGGATFGCYKASILAPLYLWFWIALHLTM